MHRARRERDNLHVALKRWHRPVALARPGSAARQGAAPVLGHEGAMPCDDEDVACFEQEVAVHLACAERPIDGLVKFIGYGFIEDGRTPEVRGFIAMELVEGDDLRRVLLRGAKPSYARIATWARQLASTLDELHVRGIVHRDVKASNIMLSKSDDSAVLIDLGLAVRLQAPEPGTALAAVTSYQSELRCGVPGYRARNPNLTYP